MRKPTVLSGPFIGFCVLLRLILARTSEPIRLPPGTLQAPAFFYELTFDQFID